MTSSLLLIDLRTKRFADEYVAIWETSTPVRTQMVVFSANQDLLINTLLTTLGPSPFENAPSPSSRHTFMSPDMAFE